MPHPQLKDALNFNAFYPEIRTSWRFVCGTVQGPFLKLFNSPVILDLLFIRPSPEQYLPEQHKRDISIVI